MPQRKELTWSELRVGVFVLVGILVVMVLESSTSPARASSAPSTGW